MLCIYTYQLKHKYLNCINLKCLQKLQKYIKKYYYKKIIVKQVHSQINSWNQSVLHIQHPNFSQMYHSYNSQEIWTAKHASSLQLISKIIL